MKTANERLLAAAVSHLVDLARYNRGLSARIKALLLRADADLSARLFEALSNMDATAFTIKRLDAALKGVNEALSRLYADARGETERELRGLSDNELEFARGAINAATPASVKVLTVSQEQAWAAAMSRPFQGRLLSEWYESLSDTAKKRLRDTVARGFVEGKTVQEMVRDVRGTKAQNWKDGIMEVSRRDAEAVVRSATSHVAASARRELYRKNQDLIREEMWVSTLDGRTSEDCQIRDGLRYTCPDHDPIGHDVPWRAGPGEIHWNCRSTSVPVLETAAKLGLDLPPMERAAMSGPVPAAVKYGDWLKAQGADRQDDVLGPTRGKLMRSGKMPFDRFFDDRGRYLTLDELRDRNAGYFKEAGL